VFFFPQEQAWGFHQRDSPGMGFPYISSLPKKETQKDGRIFIVPPSRIISGIGPYPVHFLLLMTP